MKNLLFLLTFIASQITTLHAQRTTPSLLRYAEYNKPSEALFYYKKYNEKAHTYNIERKDAKKARRKNVLLFFATPVLYGGVGYLIGLNSEYGDTEKWAATFAGTGVVFYWILFYNGGGGKRAQKAYTDAINSDPD